MEFKLFRFGEHTKDTLLEEGEKFLDPAEKYSKDFKKSKGDSVSCFRIDFEKIEDIPTWKINTKYIIGLDWLEKEKNSALLIHPKYNDEKHSIDYFKMLFESFERTDVASESADLYQIDWDSPRINIKSDEDFLTPFLIVQFLSLLKRIVKKGLRKSYYRVEKNMHSRVKGKILVTQTVRDNLMKHKPLDNWCAYEEFGLNNPENRLFKKALSFVSNWLGTNFTDKDFFPFENHFNYLQPAFTEVSDHFEFYELRKRKFNNFYKDYNEAVKLAEIILRRFSFNIDNTVATMIPTQPFWIDMTKLFEIYVLAKLKEKFGENVTFQFNAGKRQLDYLIHDLDNDIRLVVDAKYKTYKEKSIKIEDIRQISGYARHKTVYKVLKKEYPESLDCLIIYPDLDNGLNDFADTDFKTWCKENKVSSYKGIYKLGVKLPMKGKLSKNIGEEKEKDQIKELSK